MVSSNVDRSLIYFCLNQLTNDLVISVTFGTLISFSKFVVLATTRFVDIHTESFLKWTKLLFNYDVRQEDMQKISSGHMYNYITISIQP
jgi:hypothetical protein